MTARDRLVFRSIAALLAGLVALVGIELAVPGMRREVGVTLMFVAAFAVGLGLAATGRSTLAAWLVIAFGWTTYAVRIAVTGGPDGGAAVYLPVAAMVAWSWLGRRVGLAVIGVLLAVLASTWAFLPPPAQRQSPDELMFAYLVTVLLGVGFVALVTSDLRVAAGLAFRRAAEAEASAAEATALDGARDRFLAMVSHELRTPLDSVLGYAELLQEEESDPDRARDLGRVHAAGRQLLALVDDLLDMSRLQTDDVSVTFEPVPIGPLVDEVVSTARCDRLVTRVPDDLPPLVSDRRRIRQILLNLVSNSAKYATSGEIRLDVSAVERELRLAVRDEGIGIAAERMSELYKPFVQLHDGPERRPGVGLGLALSQRLAERLGGRIDAASAPGVGSTFTLRLPLGPGRAS